MYCSTLEENNRALGATGADELLGEGEVAPESASGLARGETGSE